MQANKKIFKSFESFEGLKSGWVTDCVFKLKVKTALYRLLAGLSYIPLPPKLRNTKCVLNIQNKQNEKCFLWSVLAKLYPANKHADRVEKYRKYENTSMLKYPIIVQSIENFEKKNYICKRIWFRMGNIPSKICETKNIHTHKFVTYKKSWNQSLLLNKKKLDGLLYSSAKYRGRMYYCKFCLQRFVSHKNLTNHEIYCQTHEPQKVSYTVMKTRNGLNLKTFHTNCLFHLRYTRILRHCYWKSMQMKITPQNRMSPIRVTIILADILTS